MPLQVNICFFFFFFGVNVLDSSAIDTAESNHQSRQSQVDKIN